MIGAVSAFNVQPFNFGAKTQKVSLRVLTALAYGFTIYVSISATRNGTHVAAIWLANGILLASLFKCVGPRERVKTLILCYLANLFAGFVNGDVLSRTIVFSLINTTECIMAYWLVRRYIGRVPNFADSKTLILFVGLIGVMTPIIPSVFGALGAKVILGGPFLNVLKTWYPAHILGLITVTPAVLVMLTRQTGFRAASPAEVLSQFALLSLVSGFVFAQSTMPLLFLILPVMVSIAFRIGPRYAALASLAITVVAIFSTYKGFGPIALVDKSHPALRIYTMQLFCAVNLLTSLAIAAVIAERDRLRLVASENKRQLDAALTHMSQGLSMFDIDGKLVMRNSRFLEMYNLQEHHALLGATLGQMMSACQSAGLRPQNSGYRTQMSSSGDFDQELNDGRHIRISQRQLSDGSVVCTYSDITSDKKAQEELLHRSRHDVLTDLPNRRVITEHLEAAQTAYARGAKYALLLIDIDHFKTINDSLGHATGDDVLIVVANALVQSARENDIVARLGGDEFAVLLADCDEREIASLMASKLLIAIRQAKPRSLGDLALSLSIGIAFLPADAGGPSEALKAADEALYASKLKGRDCYSFFASKKEAAEEIQSTPLVA